MTSRENIFAQMATEIQMKTTLTIVICTLPTMSHVPLGSAPRWPCTCTPGTSPRPLSTTAWCSQWLDSSPSLSSCWSKNWHKGNIKGYFYIDTDTVSLSMVVLILRLLVYLWLYWYWHKCLWLYRYWHYKSIYSFIDTDTIGLYILYRYWHFWDIYGYIDTAILSCVLFYRYRHY